VGVDLHGHGDLGVTKDLHRDPGVDVEGGQERSTRVAGVMDADLADPGTVTPAVELAVKFRGSTGVP
jgi:hypothetical protein